MGRVSSLAAPLQRPSPKLRLPSCPLASGESTAEPGAEIPMGRMGSVTLDDTTTAAMSDPFTYDASNVADFADIF